MLLRACGCRVRKKIEKNSYTHTLTFYEWGNVMRMGVIQNDDRFISIASKSKRILIHDDAM